MPKLSWRTLVAALHPADPSEARRAVLMKPILQAVLVVMLVVGPLWVYFSPPNEQPASIALAATGTLTTAALIPLAGRGHSRAASLLLPTALVVIYGVGLWFLGGVRSPVTSGLLVVVVLAHVLLGERGALLYAGLGILALLFVYLGETQGLVPVWPAGAGRAWVLITGQLAFAARLLSLTLRPMREGLADARREQSRESERARELDALLQAHGALLSTLELDGLLDNILKAAMAAIPASEKGTVLLLAPERDELQIRAMHGYTDPRIQTLAFVGTSGYSARTLRSRRPWLIHDARAEPEVRYDGDLPEVRAIRAAISAPLLVAGEPVGVLTLDATQAGAFEERDLRLLVAFANTAAVAIRNAALHAEVQTLANRDALTGAGNRRLLDTSLAVEVARAERYGHSVSLIFMDLDSFKVYNDTYGHTAGDTRLREVANMLNSLIRSPDMLARYGGEEFALLLPHTQKGGALALAERMRAVAQAAAPAGAMAGNSFLPGFTLSVGVATFPDDAATAQGLLQAADAAELAAKNDGKNRVRAAPSLRRAPAAHVPEPLAGAHSRDDHGA